MEINQVRPVAIVIGGLDDLWSGLAENEKPPNESQVHCHPIPERNKMPALERTPYPVNTDFGILEITFDRPNLHFVEIREARRELAQRRLEGRTPQREMRIDEDKLVHPNQ